jgi:CubicO group peptidase (beta-lactamase class C family)
MYDFLSGYQLTRDPGEQFEYSNLGVGLLGHVLSRATGQSYEEMERQRVWAPLGMTNTAITLTPWMKAHLALSTTNDMLKFLGANLHPEHRTSRSRSRSRTMRHGCIRRVRQRYVCGRRRRRISS